MLLVLFDRRRVLARLVIFCFSLILLHSFATPTEASPPLGSHPLRPAYSAKQIIETNPSAGDGIYWIDPDGGDTGNAFQAYCDMTTAGGGWTLGLVGLQGAAVQSNDITSHEGTAGLNSRHTLDLTPLAIDQQAQIRHQIDNGSGFDGFYSGKYHDPMANQGDWAILGGDPAYMQYSFGQPWGAHPQYGATHSGYDIQWYYSGGSPFFGSIPSTGWMSSGPWTYANGGQWLNNYRIFVREENTPPAPLAITRWVTAGGSWDNGANWTFGLVPDPTDDVRISPESGIIVAGSSGNQSIKSLVVGTEAGIAQLQLPNDLSVSEDVVIERRGLLSLYGGMLTVADSGNCIVEGELSGYGTVSGCVSGSAASKLTTSGGNLTLGKDTLFQGFVTEGELDVSVNTITLRSRGFAGLGSLTSLVGGTLIAANGVALGVGGNMVGEGSVEAKIAAGYGSIIAADGTLAIGDANAYDGFFSDGVLYVNDNTVTINDKNEAVLGSLTEIGSDGSSGTLIAANGLLVEFGKNVVGYGTIDTPDNAATPLMNNGTIAGNSGSEQITLNGYVKGVGTFSDVVFAGTYSPGLSPAEVTVGDIEFADTSTLVMELGGLNPGSEYDVLHVSGSILLDGTLEMSLINGFTPSVGNTFTIMTFDSVSGDFGTYQGMNLGGGLLLEPSLTPSTLMLTVEHAIDGDANGDGVVDVSDLGILATNYGTSSGAEWSNADFNGDSKVDVSDLGILATNYGNTTDTVAVPEPGSMTLLLCGLSSLIFWRRRE